MKNNLLSLTITRQGVTRVSYKLGGYFTYFSIQEHFMTAPTRKPYPSDLTDDQWNLIEPLIPPKVGKGEDRKGNLRGVVNGILYVLRTGCQWDYLPHDLLPKGRVENEISRVKGKLPHGKIAKCLSTCEAVQE